jgi:SNF2 family DNA or RNA helicase
VDEAHNFKSSRANSKRTEALAQLKSENLFLLSGTPIVNGGEDLYNYLSLINPEEYPQEANAKKRFNQKISTPEGAEEVYKVLKDCMLRRRIADYDERIREIKEAAEKQEITVELKGKIREVYLKVVESFQKKAAASDVLSQKDYVRALHLLKKIETDPFLVSEEAEKNTIFSYLTGQELEGVFGTTVPGEVASILSREPLPEKIQKTIEMIRDLPEGEKAVVYVCNPETARRMATLLEEEEVPSTFISGEVKDGTRRQDRSRRIADFNNPESNTKVLVMNQVGGEGLNLQSASHLFKLDSPWTAAQDTQIDARIIRLGQKLAVKIYSFVTRNLAELRPAEGNGQPIRTVDSYARRVVLPAKERLAEFFLEGLLTGAELAELEEMREAEKRIMLRLAEAKIEE